MSTQEKVAIKSKKSEILAFFRSGVWEDIANIITTGLVEIQIMNERLISERNTDFNRGLIASCRQLLAMPTSLIDDLENQKVQEQRDIELDVEVEANKQEEEE